MSITKYDTMSPLLREMVAKKMPEVCNDEGEMGLMKASVALGMPKQSIHYIFFNHNRLSADRARALIKLSGGRITAEDILPYII